MKPVGGVLTAVGSAVFFVIAVTEVEAIPPKFEDLTLQIALTNDTIFPMEPVRLTITLGNRTEQPVLGHDRLHPGLGTLTFRVAGKDGLFHIIHLGTVLHMDADAHEKLLPPGYEQSEQVDLWHGTVANSLFKAIFPEPGKYSFKANLTSIDRKSSIESNIVQIRVLEPEPVDEAAWEYLRDYELKNGRFFFISTYDPKELAGIEKFIGLFPNSRYVLFGHYTLGLSYYITKNLDQARASLETVARRKHFFYGDKVLYYLIQICLRSGKIEEARSHLSVLKTDYPGSTRLEPAERNIYRATRP